MTAKARAGRWWLLYFWALPESGPVFLLSAGLFRAADEDAAIRAGSGALPDSLLAEPQSCMAVEAPAGLAEGLGLPPDSAGRLFDEGEIARLNQSLPNGPGAIQPGGE